jgi:hypothetical protein
MLKKVILSIFIICLFLSSYVFADDRDYPIDIIVALDKSLSMEEEISAVKEYINSAIVDDKLQKGDFFLVVSFFGKSTIPISTIIEGEGHKESIKQNISNIEADGHYTDIGRALDAMKMEVEKHSDDTRQKLLLLITDGLHNPEPASEYFTQDGTVTHEYLKDAEETQRDGWKIIVIGIGEKSAKELAEDLNAEYVETSDEVTPEELEEIVPEGIINVTGDIIMTPVDFSGNSTLIIPYTSKLYKEAPEIVIDSIQIDSPRYISDILKEPFSAELVPEGDGKLDIPVYIKDLAPGEYTCNITLIFSSKEKFQEKYAVSVKVNTLWESLPWLFPLIILAGIGILVLIVFLILLAVRGKALKFRLIVEEHPLGKGKDEFTVRKGKENFLKETMDIFDIVPKKTRKSIAKLVLTDSGLRMTILKEERFPDFVGIPKNVLGNKFTVRTEKGDDCTIRFVKTK